MTSSPGVFMEGFLEEVTLDLRHIGLGQSFFWRPLRQGQVNLDKRESESSGAGGHALRLNLLFPDLGLTERVGGFRSPRNLLPGNLL